MPAWISPCLLAKTGHAKFPDTDWPQYEANPFVIPIDFDFNDEDGAGSIIAADLDNDGLMDYLVTRPGNIGAYSHFGKRLWHLKLDVQVSSSSETYGLPGLHAAGVQAADIDGDGSTEVVFLTRDGLLNIAAADTGKLKTRRKLPFPKEAEHWENVIIANLRGKGDRDLILQATNREGYRMGKFLAAYASDNLDGQPLWQTSDYLGCAHTGARIADIDGDGRDEVLGATVIDHDGKLKQLFDVRGHLDSIFVNDIRPDTPGLEIVALEEGGQRVFLFNKDRLIWESDYKRQEPQNAAVGEFDCSRKGLEIWCRSRYDEHQKPFVFDANGAVIADYEMDKVAPEGWTVKGVEEIWTIDWTGQAKQLAAAKERHKSGDVCIFDPLTGKFLKRFKEKADRLYVADVSGDWREEIIVCSGREIHIYHNSDPNPDPNRERLWKRNYYKRNKVIWNYYSP
ncbi:MAG: FG-GAP-like repeat-containing protein [Armatimonadetes bacterium]|nr:FG-GAP-like repeat-containing protein [Armatimonadota bacterium]